MTDDLKNRLFGRKQGGNNDSDYIDADNLSIYALINRNKNILIIFCFLFMFAETFVIGSVGYLFKNHFTYSFFGAIATGFKSIPLNYVLWGMTLISFSCLYLVRYRKNPRFDDERRYTKSHLGTYGTADWMQKEEFDTFLLETRVEKTDQTILGARNGKVVVMNPEVAPKDALNPHFFIVGASGSRKTRTYVFNAIFQAIERGESVIMSDPKGELYRNTYTLFKKYGYNTKAFNLKEPLKSDHWAVLAEAAKGTDSAQILCDVIIKNTGGEKGDEFFNNAELNLLKAIILFVVSSSWHKEHNMDNMKGVYDLILTCNDADLMNETLGSFVNSNPDHPSYQPYKIYEGAGKLKNNIIVGLGSRLNLFQNQRITNLCSYDKDKEIDLVAPLKEKCAYFVITSDQESSTEVLSSLFFSFLFIDQVAYYDKHMGKSNFKPKKVNYILDEFINCGVIPDMDKKITTVRSRGLALSLIVQNIGQMKDRYRYNWEALISNCDTTCILSVGKNDNTTAKWVSEILGTQTVEAVSNVQTYSKSSVLKMAGQYKETKGIGKRALLSPDEVTSLVRDKEILLFSSHHPLLLDKYDYTNHPMSEEMSDIQEEFDDEIELETMDTTAFMSGIAKANGYVIKSSSENEQQQINKNKSNQKNKKNGFYYKNQREKSKEEERAENEKIFEKGLTKSSRHSEKQARIEEMESVVQTKIKQKTKQKNTFNNKKPFYKDEEVEEFGKELLKKNTNKQEKKPEEESECDNTTENIVEGEFDTNLEREMPEDSMGVEQYDEDEDSLAALDAIEENSEDD